MEDRTAEFVRLCRTRAAERRDGGKRRDRSVRSQKEGDMEKVLRCGDLMAGCQHVVRGATEDDVLRQAAKHAAEAHNIKEVTPDLAAKVKSKIRTE